MAEIVQVESDLFKITEVKTVERLINLQDLVGEKENLEAKLAELESHYLSNKSDLEAQIQTALDLIVEATSQLNNGG